MKLVKYVVLVGLLCNICFSESLYKIQPEDKLSIVVWPYSELNMDVIVRLDGYISYPTIGEIKVQGLTAGELGNKIEKAISEYVKSPKVAVNIIEYSKEKVFILGMVNSPGTYNINPGETIIDAISKAKGTNKDAKTNEIGIIKVKDNKPIVITVDLDKILKEGRIEENKKELSKLWPKLALKIHTDRAGGNEKLMEI